MNGINTNYRSYLNKKQFNRDVFRPALLKMPSCDTFSFKGKLNDEQKNKRALELAQRGIDAQNALEFAQYSDSCYKRVLELLEYNFDSFFIKHILSLSDEMYQSLIGLIDKNVDIFLIKTIFREDKTTIQQIIDLINKGADAHLAFKAVSSSEKESKKIMPFVEAGACNFDVSGLKNANDDLWNRTLKAVERGYNQYYLNRILSEKDETRDRMLDLAIRGVQYNDSRCMTRDKFYSKATALLEEGVDIEFTKTLLGNDAYYNNVLNFARNRKTPMKDFINSDGYKEAITKASSGKYQKELIEILSTEQMDYTTRKQLIECNLEPQDFLDSISKLSKSTFKFALNTPNQYLSNIPTEYSTKVDGKYPQLPEFVKKAQQIEVCKFFRQHIGELTRALKYIDTDTLNQMMDKRFELFGASLYKLNRLSNQNYELLSELIRCTTPDNKPLTARQKVQLTYIVEIYQDINLSTDCLKDMSEQGVVDIDAIKQVIKSNIFQNAGLTQEQIDNIPPGCEKFDDEYSYLLLMDASYDSYDFMKESFERMRLMDKETLEETAQEYSEGFAQELLSDEAIRALEELKEVTLHIKDYTDDELIKKYTHLARIVYGNNADSNVLNDVIKQAATGNFEQFIFDESNKYGFSNKKTQEAFLKNKLDYNKWLKPGLDDLKLRVNSNELTIKFWDRNPQQDLFMGNKTTCCTAIGTGVNALATPMYLLSTAFNVVDIYSKDNELIGMSRVFMANINNKPSVVIDNIELNSTFIKGYGQKELTLIRDSVFEYISKYAKEVSNNQDIDVYFYANDIHVPMSGLKVSRECADFIGEISEEKVYINSAGCKWLNPSCMRSDKLFLAKVS